MYEPTNALYCPNCGKEVYPASEPCKHCGYHGGEEFNDVVVEDGPDDPQGCTFLLNSIQQEDQMLKLSQHAIVDLFVEKLKALGCRSRSHVAGKADPSEITVIEGEIGMGYGLDTNWPGPYEEPPGPQIIKVKVVENPYGTDVCFRITLDDEKTSLGLSRAAWESAYLDDDNKWHRATSEDFFKHLQRLITESTYAKTIKDMMLDGESEFDSPENLADFE